MTWTETEERVHESVGESGGFGIESPFTARGSVSSAETPLAEYEYEYEYETAHLGSTENESPFASPFTTTGPAASESALLAEIIAELRSGELAEAIGEVVQEVSGIHAEHIALTSEAPAASAQAAELASMQHLQLLNEQTDRFLETMAMAAGEREVASISEHELAEIMTALEAAPSPATESPAFENFFGALRRTVQSVVSKAVDLGKRAVSAIGSFLPLNAIIGKLRELVQPLLKRVLTQAINRLPASLRPIAEQLRVRLFGGDQDADANEQSMESPPTAGEQPVGGEVGALELEFIHEVAQMMLGRESTNENESTWHEQEWAGRNWEWTNPPASTHAEANANEIDAARVRLITELARLGDGESAAPAFEQFLPAVLPALRLGITVVGRGRVVNILAGLLAKLIGRYVGPQLSMPLSQAVVDAGLRILTLEAPTAQETALAGPAAVAAVVEDTARRLGRLQPGELESPDRLEVETMVAFNEAVARNFPPTLLRPDLEERESPTATAMWALRPRVYWFKKYTKVFEITLTPQMAAGVTTFGGVSLAAFLKSVHGVTKTVRVRVHMYETLTGTLLSRISALERHVPYMRPNGWRRFHPLSVQAASTLLAEPGLGKDVDAEFTATRTRVAAGQRFFYLELPVPGGGHGVSQAFVTVDGRPMRNVITAFVYLSEADAQAIASRARQGNTTALVVAMRAGFAAAVNSLRKAPASRITVLRESESGEHEVLVAGEVAAAGAGAGIASAIGGKVAGLIVDKLIDAVLRFATDYVAAKRDDFVAAADNPKSGVTVIVTIPAPGLSTVLRGGLVPSIAQIGALRTLLGTIGSTKLVPSLHTVAGFRRG